MSAFGEKLERIVLIRPRTRGDYWNGSDYNAAVFLRDYAPHWEKLKRSHELTTEILVDTGIDISVRLFQAGAYREDRPLMQEIIRDGHDLWSKRTTT